MLESLLTSFGEFGRDVGLFFGLAFLAIIFVWAQFLVRWRDEKWELGISEEGLKMLLRELEEPTGRLHGALLERFRGHACSEFTNRKQMEKWFDQCLRNSGSRYTGGLFENYLWGVLSTARVSLRSFDNRVSLIAVRNELKRYSYHRWLNFGLANMAVSMGILGTVTGLWSGFNQIDFSGHISLVMEEVMDSLARALYTTAIGVLISMPIIISGLKMEQQLEELFGMVQEIHYAVVATLKQIEMEESRNGAG